MRSGIWRDRCEQVKAMPTDDLRAMGRHAAAVARGYSPQNCAKLVLECISACHCWHRGLAACASLSEPPQ